MGFYDKFKGICEAKGVAQSRVALDIGLSKSAVIKWKHGDIPKMTTLQKLADYFNVSADYFLDIAEDMPKVAPDVQELIEDYNSRPEMKMLFKAAKGVTAEDIERAAKFLEAMKGDK